MSNSIKEGNALPDFELKNQSDKPIQKTSLTGKWVVLYFYPKDNTPGCTQEACDFSESIQDFETLQCAVYGVSPDSVQSHAKFISKKDLKVELLSDPEHELTEACGYWQKKKMFGKEYMGVVRSTLLVDPEGKVRKFWSPVKVKGHIEEVKEALKTLIAS